MAKANNASDAAASAAWLWKATAKGNPVAPVRLADMYVQGNEIPRSCEQALVLLQAAATKENAQARTRLAELYDQGVCVQRNLVKAYRWLSAALAVDPKSNGALQDRDLVLQQMTPEERAEIQPSR
jgi:TPR repeat protein